MLICKPGEEFRRAAAVSVRRVMADFLGLVPYLNKKRPEVGRFVFSLQDV
jgi:hypothetical protein